MDHHCAVACPVVTEAVQAATPESRIKMAIAAIKAEKISQRAAAERFGVSRTSLERRISTGPNGPVVIKDEDPPPEPTKGKDGKLRHPPASPELISKAWELKDAGSNTAEIARALDRSWPTVNRWLSRPRPEPAPDRPAPAPEPLILTPPESESKPAKPRIPDAIKKTHRNEQRRIKERWQPIAEHLKAAHDLIKAEKERLCADYAGPRGSLIMQRRWQQLAEHWQEAGLLDSFAEITGQPDAKTLDGLLRELERSTRMSGDWIKAIAMFTGCRHDSNRYRPQTVEEGEP